MPFGAHGALRNQNIKRWLSLLSLSVAFSRAMVAICPGEGFFSGLCADPKSTRNVDDDYDESRRGDKLAHHFTTLFFFIHMENPWKRGYGKCDKFFGASVAG